MQTQSQLKRWAPWFCAVAFCSLLGYSAPSIVGSGCTNCVIRTGDTMSGTLTSSVGSGSNAIAFSTNGARLDLGTGASDYWTSDGTTISTPAQLSISGASLQLSSTTGILTVRDPGTARWTFNVALATFISDESSLTTTLGFGFRPTANNNALQLGGGRNSAGTIVDHIANSTSGYVPEVVVVESVTPASGTGTFSSLEIRPTINGTSSGTATALAIATLTNTLTGGTVLLADFGTTTSTYGSGFSRKASLDTTGYFTSTTPFALDSVYVNTTISAFTYGGSVLPAHAFTAQAIRYRVRTVGSGGSTNATFRVSDGTNNCDFSFACNQAAASYRQATTAGTCTFAASATLSYAFSSTGDCTTKTDILGNIAIDGIWQ